MASHEYHFITHWQMEGTVEEVCDILMDLASLGRWWPSVYLEVNELEPEGEGRVGKVVSLCTKGWLPYTLRWKFRVTESRYPYGFSLQAWGDLEGSGIWSFEQEGPRVNVTYGWEIRADKPLLRTWSFLLRPIFSANHRWAMAKGEESLRLELSRRRAATAQERARIPAPPAPTPTSPTPLLLGMAVALAAGASLVYKGLKWLSRKQSEPRP